MIRIPHETKHQTLNRDYGGKRRRKGYSAFLGECIDMYRLLGVFIVLLSATLSGTMIYGAYQLWQQYKS